MTCRASSNRPGFSYLVGVNDKDMSRLRNFFDATSTGGDGTFGKLRNDAYDGGVAPYCELLEEDGRNPGDCGGLDGYPSDSGGLEDEARSRGEGEALRERPLASSFSRFVFNRPSNCCVKPFAQFSS
jgi:hypothetical protein